MEDLEDYLQELFDEYNVTPWDERATEKPIYHIGFDEHRFMGEDGDHYLKILNIPTRELYRQIISSLNKIKPNIENRLGFNIHYEDRFANLGEIKITLGK